MPETAIVRCDSCEQPVEVTGVRERHYVHVNTRSVFCSNIYATVDGCTTPPPQNGRKDTSDA